jgi:hypothetical protein
VALHWAKTDVPRYLKEKRARKTANQLRRSTKRKIASALNRQRLYQQFGQKSKIVEMLAHNSSQTKILHKGALVFKLPEQFSVIDSPEQSVGSLCALAAQMLPRRISSVSLDQSGLKIYDLSANGILDILVDELSIEARRTGRKLRWRGTYPKDPTIRRFVQAMGVIKRLKIEHEYPEPREAAKLELFDARSKHYIRALRPKYADKKAHVTRAFADHVNRCLQRVSRELTPDARSRLCQYVGEIIDNAEEHAGMFDWTIQGYLDTHTSTPVCEISIFNFGKSISETLSSLPEDSYTKTHIKKYIDLHSDRGLFRKNWRKDDLYTLIALQGNVSSKNYSEDDTRGNGTVDLIEFFQKVHDECRGATNESSKLEARMAIVSGSTYILFDGKYRMAPTANGNRVIAFNATNDLTAVPDANYVRPIEGVMFPGTVIGIQFSLKTDDSQVVQSVGESHDQRSDH